MPSAVLAAFVLPHGLAVTWSILQLVLLFLRLRLESLICCNLLVQDV